MNIKNKIQLIKFNYKDNSLFEFSIILLFLLLPAIIFLIPQTSNSETFFIFIFIYLIYLFLKSIQIIFFNFLILFLIYILILIHTILSDFNLGFYSSKQLFSIILLFFFFTTLSIFSYLYYRVSDEKIDKIVINIYMVFIIIWLFSLFYKFDLINYSKPMFPFTEPSFYALNFSVFVFYFIYKKKKYKSLYFLFCIAMGLLIENLTFFVLLILMLLIIYKVKKLIIILFFLTCLILISNQSNFVVENLDFSYYLDRISFDESSDNLSALCYNLGIEMAVNDFVNTNGLGVGFQQMGTYFSNYNFNDLIIGIFGDSLNLKDGTFYAAKIISEFGILGILFLVYFLIKFYKSVLYLKRNSFNPQNTKFILINIIIVTSFIDIFVRSQGSYFTPKFFILCFALFNYNEVNRLDKAPNMLDK